MSAWDVNLYLRFGNERSQPTIDLVSRVSLSDPQRIIDVGCGPGNSTEILRQRWPNARVTGLDSSPEMIDAARKAHPDQEWLLADAAVWQAEAPFDLVFSNAALQWVPNHARLMPRLMDQVAPGGALAFQIPSRVHSLTHQFILDVADDPEWMLLLAGARRAFTMEPPPRYYDLLVARARLEMWETEYYHVMADHDAILQWMRGASARPFLEALDTEQQRQRFLGLLARRVAQAYQPQRDGKILFPFRRLFVVAYR